MMPLSRSTADSGNTPQSALPMPQLMPNKIMARTGSEAASSSRRISTGVNNFGPLRARSNRSVFCEGRLNPCP